jgi:hypothetical protein
MGVFLDLVIFFFECEFGEIVMAVIVKKDKGQNDQQAKASNIEIDPNLFAFNVFGF